MKRKFLKIFLYIIFFGSILVAAVYYCFFYRNQGASNKIYSNLEEQVDQNQDELHKAAQQRIDEKVCNQKKDKKETEMDIDEIQQSTYLDLPELQKINEDIYAWIEVPDTNVNYPVLTSTTDNFYLMHNINGSYGYPGCIYSNALNGIQFDSQLTVLYGHNMKNETMFGSLNHFREDNYFKENPYIYIYTEADVLVYQILAISEWDNQNILQEYGYDSETGKQSFLERVTKNHTIQYREITQAKECKVLILSTCVRGQEKKRLLVIAVKI